MGVSGSAAARIRIGIAGGDAGIGRATIRIASRRRGITIVIGIAAFDAFFFDRGHKALYFETLEAKRGVFHLGFSLGTLFSFFLKPHGWTEIPIMALVMR